MDLSDYEKDYIEQMYALVEHGNFYQLLSVEPDAHTRVIKAAYYQQSQRWHPDHYSRRNVGEYLEKIDTIFTAINEAYQTLKDERMREAYDRRLEEKRRERSRPVWWQRAATASRQTRDEDRAGEMLPADVLDEVPEVGLAPATQRFADTQDLMAYGMKLGLGKMAQEQAIQQLRARFPEQAGLMDDPVLRALLKLGLPLLGLQLAHQVRDDKLASRIRDASQGMLLVNTIDTTAEVAGTAASVAAESGRMLLGLFGVSGEDAEEVVRQLGEDLGMSPSPVVESSRTRTPQ